MASPLGSGGAACGRLSAKRSPGLTRYFTSTMVALLKETWPSLIRLCTRVRLNSGRRSERKRSSLTPAWLPSASAGRRLRGCAFLGGGLRSQTMAVVNEPDNTPLPGTVFTPRQVRVLKIAVIVMGLLLVGGFAFVLAAIVYQASKGEQSSTPSGEEAVAAELHIPK